MARGMLLLVLTLASTLGAQNATTPGAITDEIPTSRCLGFRWAIGGDDNLNCTVQVEYRAAGTGAWLPAQSMLRVEPASVSGNAFDPGNLLAGSVLGLQPDTDYEVRLTLSDPDGGSSQQTRSLRTRAIPGDPASPNTRYVMPGSGGGTGSQADPFKGLVAAHAAAAPGDVFLLQAGTYTIGSTFTFSKSGTAGNPIVWRGVDASTVILDGAGTAQPILSFSGCQYVHLEDVTLRRPQRTAINGTATRGLVIRGCSIDCSAVGASTEATGIVLQGAGHESAYICANTMVGNASWTAGRSQDSYACSITGRGHELCFNENYNWWDTFNLGANDTTVDTSGNDVYGNECHEVTDDGIELDGSRFNNRVFENRFTNVLCGISAQPVLAGPCYLVRNVVYNFQLKPLKFHVLGSMPTGILVYNNTLVGADERGLGGGEWSNCIFRNNLVLGSDDAGAVAFETTGHRFSWDYNGWYKSATATHFGDMNSASYATLGVFQSGLGQELHGKLVSYGVFSNAPVPSRQGKSYPFSTGFGQQYGIGSADLTLKSGANLAADAGVNLSNITDGYGGVAPDMGAYERGATVPTYGPAGAPGAGSGGGGGGGGTTPPPFQGSGGGGGGGCAALPGGVPLVLLLACLAVAVSLRRASRCRD